MIKAVIFDFNGTLYFDSDIHTTVWRDMYINDVGGKPEDFDRVFAEVFGSNNLPIIKHFYKSVGKTISDEDAEVMSKEKERRYRVYSVEHDRCHLVKGAKELFNRLKEREYGMNISSASIIENINFFFLEFGLDRWFDKSNVTYDNGVYVDKTQMYKDAAKNISFSIEDCLIFEDSVYGIECAKKAGCKNIIMMNPDGKKESPEGIIQSIRDFTEFDDKLLG